MGKYMRNPNYAQNYCPQFDHQMNHECRMFVHALKKDKCI